MDRVFQGRRGGGMDQLMAGRKPAPASPPSGNLAAMKTSSINVQMIVAPNCIDETSVQD